MSMMGLDISDREAVPWFWNLMGISNLVGYIQPDKDGSETEGFGKFDHSDIF
jgi:hypothetical protein